MMHMRPMDTHLKTRMSPPWGLYTIAAMFSEEYEVTVENENVREVDMSDCPDIVGISVNVDSLPRDFRHISWQEYSGSPGRHTTDNSPGGDS